jgi:hypothetical protein
MSSNEPRWLRQKKRNKKVVLEKNKPFRPQELADN